MEHIKDNIYDAYYNKMGEEFGKKVRERVHWITQHVKGNNVLDIGCSQGIVPILLGREGKRVLGIDISTSAIEEAKKNLSLEEVETQERIEFKKANFFLEEFNQKFDTVILGEVLEHINDVEVFFNKAVSVVKENGIIIVTTPFGINEFIDHKRTFYLNRFLKFQNNKLAITEMAFLGKWIGVVYKKSDENLQPKKIDEQLLDEFETNINLIENNYLTEIRRMKKRIKDQEKKINELEKRNKEIKKFNNENYISKEYYLNEKTEKVEIQKQLFDAYSKQENIILKYKALSQDYERLLTKYQNLRNSKLGKLTTKYWQIRNKRRSK